MKWKSTHREVGAFAYVKLKFFEKTYKLRFPFLANTYKKHNLERMYLVCFFVLEYNKKY